MMWRVLPLLLAIGWYSHQSQAYVPAWRSNQALMAHVYQMAPRKPRAATNYAGTLLEAGRMREALAMYATAQQLAEAPHIPRWDARETRETVATNVRALMRARTLQR